MKRIEKKIYILMCCVVKITEVRVILGALSWVTGLVGVS